MIQYTTHQICDFIRMKKICDLVLNTSTMWFTFFKHTLVWFNILVCVIYYKLYLKCDLTLNHIIMCFDSSKEKTCDLILNHINVDLYSFDGVSCHPGESRTLPSWASPMMIVVFITWNSDFVLLIQGLCGSNPCRFESFSFAWMKLTT